MDAEGQGPQVAEACAELVEAWEQELNVLVYKLYGLMDNETALIEQPLQKRREAQVSKTPKNVQE